MPNFFKPLPDMQSSAIKSNRFAFWLEQLPTRQRAIIAPHAPLLAPLLTTAPYLAALAEKFSDFLVRILQENPDTLMTEILRELAQGAISETDEAILARAMRQTKSKIALLAAIAETSGVWTTAQASKALSDLADASLEAGLDFLMRAAARRKKLVLEQDEVNAANCGLAIFAMGKHGGQELNYSSDIDIVAFFDPRANVLAEPEEASKFYSRLVRQLASLMEERSEYGYVFRTDLRLRPDPGSTPVALSLDAALTYYEGRGQNWERAAWIKARPAAGDIGVAENFLAELTPFIWRKHLDYAAISDIQAMKRQINIAQKIGGQRLAGHNVKLGRGGIREIEFFTQTQQLIAGGREPALRVRPTVLALEKLAANKWISLETAREMERAYWFLRAVENRLQMLNDHQTHTLAETQDELSAIACLMGFKELESFAAAYRGTLDIVTRNYNNLFVGQNDLSANVGSLVFTGADEDPATLETLGKMGFANPSLAAATIRKWHYGGYKATRAAAARAHLTELVPLLLQTICRAGNADKALARFDDFLSRLPAGVQLFALLCAHARLRELLIAFMASAPRLAQEVIRRAHVLDGLIDPARADELLDTKILAEKVDGFIDQARDFEDAIERARIIGSEQMFLIAAGLISGTIDAVRAGRQYSALAEALLERLFVRVRAVFEQRHGKIKGAKVALLAFGKLGSREMSATSDLDVILLYDVPDAGAISNGAKPLEAPHYFARLTQRFIAAVSARTAQGVLYEVDMRLRPSGNAGPLATSLTGFSRYQRDKAWTWEHLALTRARVLCADADFSARINSIIKQVLSAPGDRSKIIADTVEMRARLAEQRPPRHTLDLKLVAGGLIDIEFVAQSAILIFGDQLLDKLGDTRAVLLALFQMGALPSGEELAQIHKTMSTIIQVMSVCLVDPAKRESWSAAFKELLARLANYPDFSRLETDLKRMREVVTKAASQWYESQA
ncbi:Glutamate-ammonia-ligase adenylyltransferase [hydrothermal vent metagenome]|uniref:Glutamate-ammonia-ligase adenylyltransferase n=1 Tax=hydrothermal vent metagenome TaxID=652676 RepID=A0A3B0TLG3_9ZZZZ